MAKIELDLDRKDISVNDFTEAFEAQVRLVREVMIAMGMPAHEVRWVVSGLHYGSCTAVADAQVIGQHAYMVDVDLATNAAGAGIRALAASAHRPKFFTDEALKTARRLIQLVSEADAGKARLRFGSEVVRPSPLVLNNVDTLIKGNLPSIGSIDGRLVGVSEQNGAYSIAILDRLRGRKVRCAIPDQLLPRALQAFESRVIARGIVWSRSDGSAVRIDVRDFEVVLDDDKLPTPDEMRGILRDYERADGE